MSYLNPKHSEEQRAKWREKAQRWRDRLTPEQRHERTIRNRQHQKAWRQKVRAQKAATKTRVKHSTAVRMCDARVAGALHCESEAWRDGLCRGHYAIRERVVRLPRAPQNRKGFRQPIVTNKGGKKETLT